MNLREARVSGNMKCQWCRVVGIFRPDNGRADEGVGAASALFRWEGILLRGIAQDVRKVINHRVQRGHTETTEKRIVLSSLCGSVNSVTLRLLT